MKWINSVIANGKVGRTSKLALITIIVTNICVYVIGVPVNHVETPLSDDPALSGKINDINQNDSDTFNLLILHTNDMHSRILEISSSSAPMCRDEFCYGGFARLKLVSKQLREKYNSENWAVLFLNAGDNFQGSPFYSIYKWKVLSDLIPDLGFDVMSLGNHEFDDGVELLSDYLRNLKSPPVVGCNVDFSGDRFLQNISIARSKIFKLKGIKVAVVGYLTPETSNTGNVTIKNEIESLRSEVTHLKATNADIIIALGHSGFEMDKRIATEVPGIDLVVGGHSHSFLWNGTNAPSKEKILGDYPTWVKRISENEGGQEINVPVVQAYAYTKYLGFLKMTFQRTRLSPHPNIKTKLKLKSAFGNPILLTSTEYSEDPFMKEKIKKWKNSVDKQTNQQIGETKLFLEGDASICRNQECNLGNLVADAFVDYAVRHFPNNSMIPIAFLHSGSIRASIDSPDGKILYGDLMSTLPYSNPLVQIKLKGQQIHDIFEHSISGIEQNLGRFLQVSGLKVKYNITKPVGNRVVSILLRCKQCQSRYKSLHNNFEYETVTVLELLQGTDGYTEFNGSNNSIRSLGVTDFEVVLQYLKIHSPVYPEVEGRIRFSCGLNHI